MVILTLSRHICASCIHVDSELFDLLLYSHSAVIYFSYFGVLMAYGGLQDVRLLRPSRFLFFF
jgi:hypothetical protein